MYQLFKELCTEVGNFSDGNCGPLNLGSDSELDLERFLDFLHHFSKESKSHFKRILKFSKVGLNGKRIIRIRKTGLGRVRTRSERSSMYQTAGINRTTDHYH